MVTLRMNSLLNYPRMNFKVKLLLTSLACSTIILYLLWDKASKCPRLCSYKSVLHPDRLIFDNSHVVQHFSEFICPHNFRNLADWVYGWPKQLFNEQLDITTIEGHHSTSCLPFGSIIFVKTDYLGDFFDKVYPYLTNGFLLITGQSDRSSPGRYLSYLENASSKIIHWFGQNSEIYSSKSTRFTPIPIGKSS